LHQAKHWPELSQKSPGRQASKLSQAASRPALPARAHRDPVSEGKHCAPGPQASSPGLGAAGETGSQLRAQALKPGIGLPAASS